MNKRYLLLLISVIFCCQPKNQSEKTISALHSKDTVEAITVKIDDVKQKQKQEATTAAQQLPRLSLPEKKGRLTRFINQGAAQPEIVMIKPSSRPTTIQFARGTQVRLTHSDLVDAAGESVTGPIELVVQEFYDKSDMITSKLNTITNGGDLLESAGMIKIEAFHQKNPLRIKTGKTIAVAFPMIEEQNDMKLFYGERNERDDLIWELAENPRYTDEFVDAVTYWRIDAFNRLRQISLREGFGEFTHAVKPNRVQEIEDRDFYTWGTVANFDNKDRAPLISEMQPLHDSIIKDQYRSTFSIKILCDQYGELKNQRVYEMTGELEGFRVNVTRKGTNRRQPRASSGFFSHWDIQFSDGFRKYTFPASVDLGNSAHQQFLIQGELILQKNLVNQLLELETKERDQINAQNFRNTSNLTQVRNYVFNINGLGYINCDRFIDTPENQKFDLIVNNPDPSTSFQLIFKDINAVISGVKRGNRVVFSSIPRNEEATLFAMKYGEKGAEVALKDKNELRDSFKERELGFETVSFSELKKMITELN